MADGSFPGLVSKDRNVNATSNPIYTQLSDGTSAVGVTTGALDVNIDNASIVVTATDLDIRDLSQTQDSVLIYGNTAKDGSGTDYVPLLDADGKVIISNPGGTEYTEDAVAAATASGSTLLVERDDALTTITPAEGDWTKLYASAEGALWVQDFNSDAIAASLVDIETNTDFGAVVGGGTEATALRVTLASDSTGLLSVDDNGGSLTVDGTVAVSSVAGTVTVDGTVAATQSGTWNIGTLTSITNDVNIADGGNSITVDAVDLDIRDLTLATDAVQVSANASVNSETNPIYVKEVKEAASGNEIHNYDTAAAVASDATDNHDYTVAGTTFFLKSVIVSGSGNIKFEVQTGPLASLATVAVGFLTGRQGDTKQIDFDPPVEVPVTSTGTVRIIRTNRQGAATDLYSTILGYDV